MALVVVLWALVFLSIIAASFVSSSRMESRVARNAVEIAQARALADAGVYRAILWLLEPGEETAPRTDGTVYAWRFEDGDIRISLQDETGKVDLNWAADDLLLGLFVSLEVEPSQAAALVDAIGDFRDEDHLRRLNGAEDSDYRAAGLDREAKDRPFEAVAELQQVLGVTPELYRRVAPLLTVYSKKRTVNPRIAPPGLLPVIPGMGEAERDALLAARPEGEETLGTATAEETEARRPFATLSNQVYMVTAEARLESGARFVREAIVRFTGDPERPYLFHAWRQGERPLAPRAEEN